MTQWPSDGPALQALQRRLGARPFEPAHLPPPARRITAACFVCFARHRSGRGARGEPAWAAAVATRDRKVLDCSTVRGEAGAPYEPGLLALREGPLLEAAVRALAARADVLLVNASGRDHPRRAGLALHLGEILDVPTVGVTDRTLRAGGVLPDEARWAASPLLAGDEVVGHWVRTRAGARPVAVHAAHRTGPDDAVAIVIAAVRRARTPEPLRRARRAARLARASDE
jgi:deoxyribonuclease V